MCKGLELRNQTDYLQKRHLYLLHVRMEGRPRWHSAKYPVPCSKLTEVMLQGLTGRTKLRERERERERETMYQVNISCRVEMRVKNWKRELIDMHVNGAGWSNT